MERGTHNSHENNKDTAERHVKMEWRDHYASRGEAAEAGSGAGGVRDLECSDLQTHMRFLETQINKACGGSIAKAQTGIMKTVRWIFLAGSLLGLASCATKPDHEGLSGPEVRDIPEEMRRDNDQHSYHQDDPSEVKVDVLKYKKKF